MTGWQVVETDGRLRVLLAGPATDLDVTDVAAREATGLRAVGALDVPIVVEHVTEIPRTALGKAPLIRRQAAVPPAPLERDASPGESVPTATP